MSEVNLHLGDCKKAMRSMRDKQYDLAIVDPPYFSGPEKREYYGASIGFRGVKRRRYPVTQEWEVPKEDYFTEVFRVSKHQIIWGCNYYQWQFGPGRIIWDKVNYDSSFSDCEEAYCSLHDSVRLYRFMWNGMMQGKSDTQGHIMQGNKRLNEKRIHPTQKPVSLYRHLLRTYAQPGDKILDTHCGSGSIMIACDELGFDLDAWEVTPIHCDNAQKRFDAYKSQTKLFTNSQDDRQPDPVQLRIETLFG